MAKIKTTQRFDYRWPSGSLTAFPADFEGTVKQEVLDYAVAKGHGFDPTAKDKNAAE